MYRHILIPTDGSRPAHQAALHGLSLAKALGARITALNVEPSFMTKRVAEYAQAARAETASGLKQIAEAAKAAGVQCEVAQITHETPYEAILAVAVDKGCDVIVIASHGHTGLIGAIVGSVTQKIVAEATVPVLVYH